MIIVGYGWRVLGLRVIPEHKLAPPLIRLFGQWEKQKAFMAVAAAWGDDFFGEKEIPKHILAFLLLSLPILITTATFTIMTTNDHREWITLFGILKRSLAWYRIQCFFSLPPYHFPVIDPVHSLHSCTVWFFFCCCSETLPSGIIDTLAFWKCARVQGVHRG